MLIVVFGVLLGLAGSLVSVGRHLGMCESGKDGAARQRGTRQPRVGALLGSPPLPLACLLVALTLSSCAAPRAGHRGSARRAGAGSRKSARERDRLQQQQQRLQGQVHDVNDELQ